MKRTNKLLSALLAVCMVLTMLPTAAFAASSPEKTESSVASIGDTYYDTLKEAVDSIQDSTPTTIELLKDVEDGEGIIVAQPKDITINFNSYKYNVTKNLVGSGSNKFFAFQLLKGSTVTFNGGTLSFGESVSDGSTANRLIQDYADTLTLNDMTIDGTNCKQQVLSFNYGNVSITGNTTITAPEEGIAFDVCYAGPGSAYSGGAHVTVNTTGTISGDVELSSWSSHDSDVDYASDLNIENGTFTGDLVVQETLKADSAKDNVSITGGTFTAASDEEGSENWSNYLSGSAFDENGNIVNPTIYGAGFRADTAKANAHVTALIEQLKEEVSSDTPVNITDCDINTMYVTVKGVHLGEDTDTSTCYLEVTGPDSSDDVIYSEASSKEGFSKGCYFYFTFNQQGSSKTTAEIAPGEYTLKLYGTKSGADGNLEKDPDKRYDTKTITLAKATFNANNGTFTYPQDNRHAGTLNETNTQLTDFYAVAGDSVADILPADLTVRRGGYRHTGWSSNTISSNDMTVNALWKTNSSVNNRHDVTVTASENGTVTANPNNQVAQDTTVTLTVTPDSGYELAALAARTDNEAIDCTKTDDTTYTFTMPPANVTVTASFKEAVVEDTVCKLYKDLDVDEWYHDYVHYMIEKGYMTGIAQRTFAPSMTLNRAMVAQILYARAEKPDIAITNRFSDVKADDWYAEAVSWASANGVTVGYGNGTFRPYKAVTREELAVMLYGDAKASSVSGSLSGYPDQKDVSDWAVQGMTWAVENNIIEGIPSDNTELLAPQSNTKRSEAATMISEYFTKVKN